MGDNNPHGGQSGLISPQSLRLEDVAKILSGLGPKQVTVEMLLADIDDGAPVNRDGTLDLIAYASWMVKELLHGND
jgi:hypothetical protein